MHTSEQTRSFFDKQFETIKRSVKKFFDNNRALYTAELNDQETRNNLKEAIGSKLTSTYKSIKELSIVCDETNNPAESVDKGLIAISFGISFTNEPKNPIRSFDLTIS